MNERNLLKRLLKSLYNTLELFLEIDDGKT